MKFIKTAAGADGGVIIYALFGMGTILTPYPSSCPPPSRRTAPLALAAAKRHRQPHAGHRPAVVSMLTCADSYSRTVTVEDFWPGGNSSTELAVWVDHDRSRIRVEKDGVVRNILISDGTLYIWYDYSEEVFSSDKLDDAGVDEWLRCISYDELLELPVSSISSASYEQFGGESCIYVEYVSGDFGYTSCVYISVSTGLLMGARVYDGEELVYQMTSSAPELSAPSEDMFALPGVPISPAPEEE
ncbi:MAG: hypothetical protein ACLUEK_10270 [Oscillospiraceae bacterium]